MEGREYSILKYTTRTCRGQLFLCDLCLKIYPNNTGKKRDIKRHMKIHKNQSLPLPNDSLENNNTTHINLGLDDPLLTFEANQGSVDPPSQEEEVSLKIENAGEFSCTGSLDEMDFESGADYASACTTKHGCRYPNFGSASSDNNFGQDFQMFHDHHEVGGGFQGFWYRARQKKN